MAPDQDQVRLIFRDTYNFYLKYKDISDPEDWIPLIQDMRRIDRDYPCELCRRILLELVKIIEHEFMIRRQ